MTSFIIIDKNFQLLEIKVTKQCELLSIDPLDRVYVKGEKESSLGIELIKKLQEKIFLKPLNGKSKAIIIPQADILTTAAQNALLKLLEEPPKNTYIFLLASSKEVFLPTVLSRCQILQESYLRLEIEDSEKKDVEQQLITWNNQSIGDALKTAETFARDKDKAVSSLTKIISVAESFLREDRTDRTFLAHQLKQIQQTYTTLLSSNTNARLALEHLFLSLMR